MLIELLSVSVLYVCNFVFFITILRLENNSKNIIVTPFVCFCFFQITATWYSPIYMMYNGITPDSYPSLVTSAAFSSFLIGYLAAMRCRNIPVNFLSLPMRQEYTDKHFLFGIGISFVVLWSLAFYLYQGLPPIVRVMSGLSGVSTLDTADVQNFMAEQRFLSTKSQYFGGEYRGQGVINDVLKVGWQYLIYISMSLYYVSKRKLWIFVFLLLFLSAVIVLLGAGVRYNVFVLMFGMFILVSLIAKLRVKKAFILLILPAVMSYFLFNWLTSRSGKHEESIITRTFVGEGSMNIYIIDYIRQGILSFRYGDVHLQKIINAFPFINYGVPFSNELAGHYSEVQGTTFASPTYLGIVYSDFGIIGIFTIFFMIGLFMGIVTRIIFRMEKTIQSLAIIASTIGLCSSLVTSGFTGFVPTFIMLVVFHFFFKKCGEFLTLGRNEMPCRIKRATNYVC